MLLFGWNKHRLMLWGSLILWMSCFISCGNADTKECIYSFDVATMERLLEVIQEPVGRTMYIWGGGWAYDDAKAGRTATQIGVDAEWESFFLKQDAGYDFEEYLGQQELGLDCSGYVGWVLYNLFEQRSGQEGYVVQSTRMAETFAIKGWGRLIYNPKKFCLGDIVSIQGHVFIALGTCADGSVLLVHSSPPGVSVCGTSLKNQKEDSIAVQLAKEYMEKYHLKWQQKYPKRSVPYSYLEQAKVLRWNEKTLKNSHKYQDLTGEEVIQMLLEVKKIK